jgi:hypothetical protein
MCGTSLGIQPEETYPQRTCFMCPVMEEGEYVLPNNLCPYHNYFHQNDEEVQKMAKELGSKGGKARVEKTTLSQRQAWGKKGGRPRKAI